MSACLSTAEANCAFVLLAAGRGARFGADKLSRLYRGKPIWRWAADAGQDAGFVHRFVVVGPHSSIEAPADWTRVVNDRAEAGMGTSIAAGVAAARRHARIVIALADMPRMTATHLRRLSKSDGVTLTRYPDGHAGSPAAFPPSAFARLMRLDGDRGARFQDFPNYSTIDPADQSVLRDVDTPADLALLTRDMMIADESDG